MIQKKNLILIGGSGRNVGKTAFACRLIERQSRCRDVTGLKITVIEPLGLENLDPSQAKAYREFEGPYQILEETISSGPTDTGRMLKAGARRVLWLKARRNHLQEGLEALIELIPDDACVVAEGTSARTVVAPGLFIVIRGMDDAAMKKSCATVLPLANRVARFDGQGWDASPEDCLFIENEWMLRPRAGAVVLAGGDSRRMGRDKAFLPVHGRPMLVLIVDQLKAMFEEIVISANRPDDYRFLGLTVVPDLEPGQGPLMGIVSSLPRMANEVNFVMACDIPRPRLSFINRLIEMADGHDLVLPYTAERLYEPLFAVYRKSVIPEALRILENGGRSLLKLLDKVDVNFVRVPDRRWVRNINTEADYEALISDGSAEDAGEEPR